jgi:hypothetical protein
VAAARSAAARAESASAGRVGTGDDEALGGADPVGDWRDDPDGVDVGAGSNAVSAAT